MMVMAMMQNNEHIKEKVEDVLKEIGYAEKVLVDLNAKLSRLRQQCIHPLIGRRKPTSMSPWRWCLVCGSDLMTESMKRLLGNDDHGRPYRGNGDDFDPANW